MNNLNIEIEGWVRDLLLEVSINTRGYDVYLAGGYLRDKHCGLDYKDIDIFLIPNGNPLPLVPYTPKGYGILYTKSCEDNDDMKARGVGALIGMYPRMSRYPYAKDALHDKQDQAQLQYIVYDKPMTQEQLAGDMDMTLNQITWKPETISNICLCTDGFIEAHEEELIEFYHFYDSKRMYSRQQRMMAKFPEYDVVDTIYLTALEHLEMAGNSEAYEGSA